MSWVNNFKPNHRLCNKIYEGYMGNLRNEQIKANVKKGDYKRRTYELKCQEFYKNQFADDMRIEEVLE